MAETKRPDGRRVVAAGPTLLGVEAHPLPNDGGLGAGCAPNGVGHLEAHGEGAVGAQLGSACTEGVLVVKPVAADCALMLWGHVLAHVEALHDDDGQLGVRWPR